MSEDKEVYFHGNFFHAHSHGPKKIAKAESVNSLLRAYLTIWEVNDREELPEELREDIERMAHELVPIGEYDG